MLDVFLTVPKLKGEWRRERLIRQYVQRLANITWRSRIATVYYPSTPKINYGYCISLAWTWFVFWFQVSSIFPLNSKDATRSTWPKKRSWTAWVTLWFSIRPVLLMVMVSTCWPVRPETQRGKGWIRQRLLRDMSSCVPQFWAIPCGNSFCLGVGRTSWNGQDVAGCWSNIHCSCSSCSLNILEDAESLLNNVERFLYRWFKVFKLTQIHPPSFETVVPQIAVAIGFLLPSWAVCSLFSLETIYAIRDLCRHNK